MNKAIILSAIITTSLLNINTSHAEASTEENVGVASGAIAGAAIGGPVGLIIGAAFGAIVGDQVEKANQLDETQLKLVEVSARENQLKEEINQMQQEIALESNHNAEVKWVTDGLSLNLMFTTNSSWLSDADINNISKISKILNQFPELNIQLDGYSDPRGSNADNLILSQERVNSVKSAFETFGINPDRIISTAHGEIESVATTIDPDAFAMARKVSVNFVANQDSQLAQN